MGWKSNPVCSLNKWNIGNSNGQVSVDLVERIAARAIADKLDANCSASIREHLLKDHVQGSERTAIFFSSSTMLSL